MSELGIIGRERALVDKLAKRLHDKGAAGHELTDVQPTARGATFRVRLFDGPEYTHRIARVTVEFEGIDRGEG